MTGMQCVNRAELAQLLGVAKTSLDDYINAGMPGKKNEDSGHWEFELTSCIVWYREYLKRLGDKKGTTSLTQAKTQRELAQAALAELELEQERGRLVPVEFAAKKIEEVLSVVRANLLALPSGVASELAQLNDPKSVQEALRVAVHSAMLDVQKELEPILSE